MKVTIEKKKAILSLLIVLFLLSLVGIVYWWLHNRRMEPREEIPSQTIVESLTQEELEVLDSLYLGGGCEAGKEQYPYEEMHCKIENIKRGERLLTISECRFSEGGEYLLSEIFIVNCQDSKRSVTPADVYSRAREENDVDRMRGFYDAVTEEMGASEEEKFALLEKFLEEKVEVTLRLVEDKGGKNVVSRITFVTEDMSLCEK
jgi:hypothetical protein